MYHCYAHNWSSHEVPCPACAAIRTRTTSEYTNVVPDETVALRTRIQELQEENEGLKNKLHILEKDFKVPIGFEGDEKEKQELVHTAIVGAAKMLMVPYIMFECKTHITGTIVNEATNDIFQLTFLKIADYKPKSTAALKE